MSKKEAIAGIFKKAGGGIKVASSKAAPIISKVAGKAAGAAGAASGVAKGAVLGAGLKAGEETVGAIKDPGFVLFILGLLTFVFNEFLGNVTLAIIIGTVFMFFSSLYIFKGKGLAITIIFWVWYVFFGAVTDPSILMYYIIPIILIGMAAHGIFNKFSKRGTFMEGSEGELIGLIPVLFFFLDLGLIPLLTETFNLTLTPLVQNVILFTPWWAILGIFTTKKDNFLISLAKIASIVYIFSILTIGVAPEAYSNYKSEVPGPEELLAAREEVTAKLPQKENPAWSNLVCIFSEPTNVQACVNKRQEESEIKYICEKTRKLKSGTTAYDDCLKEEREKKKKAALQIAGTDDPSIKEPTKVEFKLSEYLKEPIISYQTDYSYPINLEIKNTDEEEPLNIGITCFFKKGNKNITGIAQPDGFMIPPGVEDTKSITCTPPPSNPLNGSYTLVYQANIYEKYTWSRLTRLFIGDPTQKTKQEIEELKRTYVPGNQYLSRAPKDFARINFGFGEPETNPIIEYDDRPLLVSTIENVGGGKILAILGYYIAIDEEGITAPEKCYRGKDLSLPTQTNFKQIIPLESCFIELPEDLKNPEDFILKEFFALLSYDYQIKKEIRIQAKPGAVIS